MSESAHSSASVAQEGGLWIVTMNRPDVLNALPADAHAELDGIFDAFFADPRAIVAILTGNGPTFCVGHDYHSLVESGERPLPKGGFGGLTRRFPRSKPVIAAVNGDALDEGFELALACDLIIANEDARFAMQQGLWGRAPLEGGVHRLIRQIPAKRAVAALLTGSPISAAEGVLLGLVNDITSYDQLLPLAREWAARIQRFSRQSTLAIQQMATEGLAAPSLEAALGAEYREVGALVAGAEYAGSIARIVKERDSGTKS